MDRERKSGRRRLPTYDHRRTQCASIPMDEIRSLFLTHLLHVYSANSSEEFHNPGVLIVGVSPGKRFKTVVTILKGNLCIDAPAEIDAVREVLGAGQN